MNTLFVIGAVAIAIGALALLADGLFDFIPDTEWFSITGLAAGVAVFCFTTGILLGAGLPMAIASIPGGIAAVVVMVGASWLIYKLRNSGSETDSSVQRLVGLTGSVVTPTRPGDHGEIDLFFAGERLRMNAISDEEIPAGARAEVIGIVSPTCVRITHLR